MPRNALLYFVKYPEPGKVKTRLARSIGNDQAAAVYRQLAEQNWRVILRASGMDVIVLFDSADKEAEIRQWLPACCQYWPQLSGDLGERLTAAFARAFDAGYDHVGAVGSDILGLTPTILEEGFIVLDQYDVVIGPAKDGGYYFIGMSHFMPQLFENIVWSTSEVLTTTKQRVRSLGLNISELSELEDLDEATNMR